MNVLAIDPGYARVGMAVLRRNANKDTLLYSSCLMTDKALPHAERLSQIGEEVRRLIALYEPRSLALERLFFNTNQRTALAVSEARGVIIFAAREARLEVHEYTPLQVKIAVTGYGRGTKQQVAAMVARLIELPERSRHDDEIDAIAVGLTHLAVYRKPIPHAVWGA
ncbi:MAG: crossover junction endodeoxyribonuclease RuvC [bacterium]|nr:crossover junction endodeoxyribonuclease RuvC [bacterium]MDZ4284965.1 crossover junction endodeoxyribonuclease RuvC [Patescibacteria group bacterium]